MPRAADRGWDSLTGSEGRVIHLVCDGLSNPQIAERLHVSRRTVSTHLYRVFKKLGVSSRAELVAKALRREQQQDREARGDARRHPPNH